MLSENIIKEAGALRKQLQSGTIVLPAIVNFLAKVELNASPSAKKKSKDERVASILSAMDSRKKPTRKG